MYQNFMQVPVKKADITNEKPFFIDHKSTFSNVNPILLDEWAAK